MKAQAQAKSTDARPARCSRGHELADDQPSFLPCPWPDCCEHLGNTETSPCLAEFAMREVVRDGVVVGELIGTFWRGRTIEGWRWRLLGSRERLFP